MNAMTQAFVLAKVYDYASVDYKMGIIYPAAEKQKQFKIGWSANLTAKTAKQLKAQGIL